MLTSSFSFALNQAYDGVRTEMEDAAKSHKKIAQSIRDLVVNPFSRWCDAHESRIQDSQDELQSRIKNHDRQAELVKKLRSNYFNKCRLVEDIEEENKLAFRDVESSPKNNNVPEIKVSENKDVESEDEEVFEIGDEVYHPDQIKKILAHMLNTIPLGEHKVPIMGTYQNTSPGTDIVEYLQRNMGTTSVSYAERIGQDLISHGFLRLIGNVGNTFANSSKMMYQWRPRAFEMAGLQETKQLGRTFSIPVSDGSTDSPVVGTVTEYLANWNVLGSAHPNETPAERLRREAREADEKYKAAVRRLDELRCDLEQNIQIHLRFLERCELDRLRAIKTVILDFSGTISNAIPILQSAVDNMMLFQETVQPASDLRYMLENYRTGGFNPKVVVYENYYNQVDEQTFGVDLEARAKADKKRVPIIVTTLLTFLDHHYPDLEGDEARRGVWLVDVPLSQTHKLRAKVNNGKPVSHEVLTEFDIPTVASLLKLYLLELPGKSTCPANLFLLPIVKLSVLTRWLPRFPRLNTFVRNHPTILHSTSVSRRLRCFEDKRPCPDPCPTAPHQHCHPGRLHEPLHPPDRLDISRRGLRCRTRRIAGPLYPTSANRKLAHHGGKARLPPRPGLVQIQGPHLLRTQAHVYRPLGIHRGRCGWPPPCY